MISNAAFTKASQFLMVKEADIKAVAHIESRGDGFLPDGQPKILFEPHVFWQQLKRLDIDPNRYAYINVPERDRTGKLTGREIRIPNQETKDILYPIWKTYPYGKESEQHKKLARAITINREAALKSASWGKFQIMGFNHKACGCPTIQDFINKVYSNEEAHLFLFVNFLKTNKFDVLLREGKYDKFFEGYNGKKYKANKYDTKFFAAKKMFS
jgi:hypothetical protein